ncbi:MAG: toprim domain-containing protein [Oscillospiraceae bacterium]|nr:toprim domain-containing protein [Oscillospiraceae bacterium]
MAKDKIYDNDSISSLKGADRVRLKPGVMFGSDGVEGCAHSFFEILSNSIDEAREGFGKEIEVVRFLDKSIKVTDYGRGIPLDYNQKEDRFNWELVYCELFAGGKYSHEIFQEGYEYSLGLNGLGCCATQYSSEFMDITVLRDGTKFELHFEKGENIGGLKKEPFRHKNTGTVTYWRPDTDVFTNIDISLDYYLSTMKKQAVVNAGLKLILKDETENGKFETYEFCYPEGIVGYVREISAGKEFSEIMFYQSEKKGRDREDKPEYKVLMTVAFCFNNEVNDIEYYHNSSWLEHGGAPDKAVKSAFVNAIDQYLKQTGKYTKNESKINFADVEDSLILVSSCFSTQTSYENQTKKAINNKFIGEAMTEFLRSNLEIYLIENKAEAEKIASQVLINKRSRENAEKAKLNLKKKLSGGIDISNRVQKFVDCRTRDTSIRELYIVEGDSALGSCKLGRDAEFQAIMPVRGKPMNCLKADYEKIFKNEIIVDLIKVLGCGVEIKSKHNKDLSSFSLDMLRWDKVIICTDADVDGYQIRTLILAMFYSLMPTLIEKGRVYIAESPLFEIKTKKESLFAYSDKEKDEIVSKINEKVKIMRSKGLGENDPDMMWQTTMNPKTRKLVRVLPENEYITEQIFELLLGDNLQGRKDFIAENGYKYIDYTEVS